MTNFSAREAEERRQVDLQNALREQKRATREDLLRLPPMPTPPVTELEARTSTNGPTILLLWITVFSAVLTALTFAMMAYCFYYVHQIITSIQNFHL